MRLETFSSEVTSNGSGVGSATVGPITGRLVSIGYVADGTAPYANTVDFTITTLNTLQTLWSESNIAGSKQVSPGQATHTNAGVAATYDGTRPVLAPYYLRNDRVQIAIAQAGAAKKGRFVIVVEA